MLAEKERYGVRIECDNCGIVYSIAIPVGICAEGYVLETLCKCVNCICRFNKYYTGCGCATFSLLPEKESEELIIG